MIFITDKDKYPLQIYLREILLTAKTAESTPVSGQDAETAALLEKMVEVVKYGVIVVSTLPIICVYPFLQKYFVKGVMIGAIDIRIGTGRLSRLPINYPENRKKGGSTCVNTTGTSLCSWLH